MAGSKKAILYINFDELKYIDVLASRDSSRMKLLFPGYDAVFIDEVQNVTDIGKSLKIAYDTFEGLKVLATGSSLFELANNTAEHHLTGRAVKHTLWKITGKKA